MSLNHKSSVWFVILTACWLILPLSATSQSVIQPVSVIEFGKQASPGNPPSNNAYVYYDSTQNKVLCLNPDGTSCFSTGGGSGTVTSIATTSPIGGGTITTTGTLTCSTCVVASSPGAGIAHFAGSTQTVTSSLIVGADINSSAALPNGVTATTQSSNDNSTKVATTAYVDAKPSGAWTKICALSASSSTALEFKSANCGAIVLTSTYDIYMLVAVNVTASANSSINLQFSTDNGSTYDSSASYDYAGFRYNSGGAAQAGNTGQTSAIIDFGAGGGTQSTDSHYGAVHQWMLTSPSSTALYKQIVGYGGYLDAFPSFNAGIAHVVYKQTNAVTAFKVFPSTGNWPAGTFELYGVQK